MAQVELRRVQSEQEAAEVAQIAREIWLEHYVPIVGEAQIEYMLEKFQTPAAISAQIVDGAEYYLLLADGEAAGYTAVVPDASAAELFLSKIYVKKSRRGRGLGQKLLEIAEKIARREGLEKIRLTVNRNNRASVVWYARHGFEYAGKTLQEIGVGFVMDDFCFEKTIGPKKEENNG